MILRARGHHWTFPRPALIMGVVNVTPDSFFDGGRFLEPGAAIARALELVEQGADIIDVGGESTRPGATPVAASEELRRVLPVIEGLCGRIQVSIDTRNSEVARAALQAGASVVNDIGASQRGPGDALWRWTAEFEAGYVLMHMQGTPADMQSAPAYRDVVSELGIYFSRQLGLVQAAGIQPERVILDVGIGFGKTLEHNLQLLAGLESFTRWERPLLLGASRKSFIRQATSANDGGERSADPDRADPDRLGGSLACACWGVQRGANIIRTHDVAATRQAVRMTEAILARRRDTAEQ